LKIEKITIGIRPASRMFRVTSLFGILIDNILGERGKSSISDSYYENVSRQDSDSRIRLFNEVEGNHLLVDYDNVSFTKDLYRSDEVFEWNSFLKEILQIWKIINKTLNINDIRSIGIVTEHRVPSSQDHLKASRDLLDKFTVFTDCPHPAKAIIKYEKRKPTVDGLLDINKNDFTNTIYEFYDSEIDRDHPADNALNFNVDIQRYFTPLFNSELKPQIEKIYKELEKERNSVKKLLVSKELIANV